MPASSPQDRPAGSDLSGASLPEIAPKKASRLILLHEIEEGIDALERPLLGLFFSGLSAGLDVGFSLFLMAVVLTRVEGRIAEPVASLLLANMYSIGFIFVILGRSELFTEQTTLAVLPTLSGRATLGALLRLWLVVFLANTLGAAAFAAIVSEIGPALGVINPHAFGKLAHSVVDHPARAMFESGILAGWLMGLLSWLIAAARDTISQIVLVWLVTSVIGFANLHHAIVGTAEVLAGALTGQGISGEDIGRFLVFVTLGNIVGGVVFVAFLKYGLARPGAQAASVADS